MRVNAKQISGFLIAFFPLLTMYKSPIPVMDIGLFIVICFIIIHFLFVNAGFTNGKGLLIDNEIMLWGLYALSLMVSLLFSGTAFSACFPIVMKNVIYVSLIILLYGYRLIDYKSICTYYTVLCDLSVVFVVIQGILFYGFKILILGYIKSWMLIPANDHYMLAERFLRSTSIFREPSAYFSFIFVGILIALFSEKKDIKRALIYSFGVVCSTSGMGVGLTFSFWGIYIIRGILLKKNKANYLILMLIGMAAVGLFLFSPIGYSTMERVFNKSYVGGNAFLGRVGGYFTLGDLQGINFLFGKGYGSHTVYYFASDTVTYFPSWAFIAYGTGLFGFIITSIIIIRMWKRSNDFVTKMLILSIIVLGAVHTIFNGAYLIFLMPFVYGMIDESGAKRSDNGALKQVAVEGKLLISEGDAR
ncbi:MAG: hypothetical protein K6E47_08160 [Lachnospiraceae bacterium]|nr:hypothetical protein [Lachnospiraceae bacterium]